MRMSAITRIDLSDDHACQSRRGRSWAAAPVPSGSQDEMDGALVGSIAERDQRAMRELYICHHVRIYRFVLHLVGNPAIAEDLVSDVFLAVWLHAAGFNYKSKVSTWLLAIARHKALSQRKRRSFVSIDESAIASIEDLGDNPETAVAKASRSTLVRSCLGRLSHAHLEVMNLVYYQDKSIEEAAEIVGIPASTVKTRMFYARCQLAQLLRAAGVDGL
jgi:RNA polymerase sigma-70 factor (ECF subfamily)